MSIKIYTIADRIRNSFVHPNELKNLQQFALLENMMIRSIPLKDGTCAKILANAIECDCLIMKNGKVVTARGKAGTAENIAIDIIKIFEHIKKRKLAEKNINVDKESFTFIDNYLTNYDKFMPAL